MLIWIHLSFYFGSHLSSLHLLWRWRCKMGNVNCHLTADMECCIIEQSPWAHAWIQPKKGLNTAIAAGNREGDRNGGGGVSHGDRPIALPFRLRGCAERASEGGRGSGRQRFRFDGERERERERTSSPICQSSPGSASMARRMWTSACGLRIFKNHLNSR